MFNFLRHCQTFLQSACPIGNVRGFQLLHILMGRFLLANHKRKMSEKEKPWKVEKVTLKSLPWYTSHRSPRKMLSCPKDTGLHWLFLKEHPCPSSCPPIPSGPMCHNLQLTVRICCFSWIVCRAPGRRLGHFISAPNPAYISRPSDHWEPLGAQKFGSGSCPSSDNPPVVDLIGYHYLHFKCRESQG